MAKKSQTLEVQPSTHQTSVGSFIPVGDASAVDINKRMEKLEETIGQVRSEQRNMILTVSIGAIIAVVFIAGAVAAQVMSSESKAIELQRQQFEDYKRLQEQINDIQP